MSRASAPAWSRSGRGRPVSKEILSWGALLGVLILAPAVAASAHASLVDTDPSDGAVLETAPEEVTLEFTEAVDVPVGGIRVFDTRGRRVDRGDAEQGPSPEQASVSMPAESPGDVYVVTWRVVSGDGHPVRGAFMFQVGEEIADHDESLVASLLGEEGDASWSLAGVIARWVTYAAALTAVGTVIFERWIRSGPPGRSRLAGWAASVGIVGSVLQVPLFGAEATGLGWGAWTSPQVLGDALSSSVGTSSALRAGGLVLLAGWRRSAVPVASLSLGMVVAAELVTGHTRTTDPQWLVMGADAVHVVAAAVWIGGLVGLQRLLSERAGGVGSVGVTVGRFSRVATWSVAALLAAGLALSWAEVRALWALTDTAYGWTLLGKVAVALAVVGMGTYNQRVLVPAVTASSGEGGGEGAWRRLRRTVRVEVAGLAAVLAVTAVLVNLQPAAEAAGVSGPYSTYVPFGEGQLNLVVDPNRRGVNQIHAYVLTETGAPRGAEGEATMEFSYVEEDVGPLRREPRPAGPGHWIHTGPELSIPGTWEVEFRLVDGLDESSASAEVRVNP